MPNTFFGLGLYPTQNTIDAQLFLSPHRGPHIEIGCDNNWLLLLHVFFILTPIQEAYSPVEMLPSGYVKLHYTLHAQIFLQPQPVRHRIQSQL
jgi:hypothetical protein